MLVKVEDWLLCSGKIYTVVVGILGVMKQKRHKVLHCDIHVSVLLFKAFLYFEEIVSSPNSEDLKIYSVL